MPETAKKILIAEDDPLIMKLIQFILRNEGYLIESVFDGKSAVTKAREFLPELLILDLMIPGINGYEVCHVLRRDEMTQHIPIMILSARGQKSEQELGLNARASAYLVKPFEPAELLKSVRRLLQTP